VPGESRNQEAEIMVGRKHAIMAASGALLFALAAVLAAALPAAGQSPSALVLTQENLTLANDSVRALSGRPDEARPDDTLRYHLQFTNTQAQEVSNVAIENPLPAGLVFVGGSVQSSAAARVEYSIDGGRTWAEQPVVQLVVDGREVERPAAPASYTHIRWTITESVAPGARVSARFDARVGARPAPTARQ
jgi:uncharacterized repeat protein (TIGR01451 family)